MSTWYRRLQRLGACKEAIEYAKTKPDAETTWKNCERGDWMLWWLAEAKEDHKRIVLAACACAVPALKHTTDPRPAAAIAVARRWARGKATLKEVRDAANAAYAAAYAANAAYAAYAAAYAAAFAAYAAANAANAAYAAAYAAYAANAAANAASRKRSATIVRRYFPAPPSR